MRKVREELQKRLDKWKDYTLTFAKWTLFAVAVGVIVGLIGSLFAWCINTGTAFRQSYSFMIYFMPLAGLLIVWSYHVTGMSDDKGTEYIIGAVREGRQLRIRTAPLIFLGTVLTHLTGGSAGREGAALQLGGSISNFIGRVFHLDEKDDRIITMCGMAAGFSALFGTPLAAAIFSLEVVSVGVMYYSAIVPCVLAALVARLVASYVGIPASFFPVEEVPALTPILVIQVLALGICCAMVAIFFCSVMHTVPKIYDRITKNPYLRVIIGGVVMIACILIFGTDYAGAGGDVIMRAMEGEAKPEAFLLKIVLTAITLSAGFKGGEIVPAFFAGATFGAFFGALIGLPGSFAASVGMTAVFCGVTNCPLTSIFLSYELFGGETLAIYAVSCAVSYMFSGYTGLYRAQKIMYSKLYPVFINHNTNTEKDKTIKD